MHPIAAQLLERHIEFELEALTGPGLRPYLRAETRRLFELAETVPLSGYATAKRCTAAFQRLLVKAKIPASAETFVVSLLLRYGHSLKESGARIEDLVSRERLLELVEVSEGFRDYRSRLLAALFSHPLYSELVSSLVYQALVSYLVEDNVISQRVPGVGSMLKLGRRVANRTVPDLDARLEEQLRGYIAGYLPSLIRASERFVDRAATEEVLAEWLDAAWPRVAGEELAAVLAGLDENDVESLGAWGIRFWEDVRHTDLFAQLGEELVGHVYERYGDQPLGVLLRDLGVTRTLVTNEVLAFAPPLARQLRASGYLAGFLRTRLTPFYASAEVSAILGSDG